MGRKWRILVGLVVVYAALDPFKYSSIAHFPDFQVYSVEDVPWSLLSSFMADKGSRLQTADVQTYKGVWGPESIAFDPHNRGPYTGIADGTIVRWDSPLLRWSLFAYTSPNRYVTPFSAPICFSFLSQKLLLNSKYYTLYLLWISFMICYWIFPCKYLHISQQLL